MTEFRYEGRSLKAGVYKITNTLNGRVYYGSTQEFGKRWNSHIRMLKKNDHHNRFLQFDYNKCGDKCFVFEILETVDGSKEERLLKEEQYLLEFFDSGNKCYNLTNKAISRERCKNKQNRACSEETKKKISEANKGRVYSEEARKNMSDAHVGYKPTDEARQNMSNAQKARKVNGMSGKKLSGGRKQQISNFFKGHTYNLGRKRSEEYRQKKREHKASEESKKKASDSMKLYWENKKQQEKECNTQCPL